ncbi:antirestriction protein, partial [Escherichia coli]
IKSPVLCCGENITFHQVAKFSVPLQAYSHHACRTECYAMTVHYYRLRDYALQHPECSAIMRIID